MSSPSSFATQLQFTHALNIVRSIPVNSTLQPVVADKLQLYGLYKQATEGDINLPRPSSRQVVEYAKWKAWKRMKGFSPNEARKLYIESLIELLTDFIQRYPKHEQAMTIKKALNSLQYDITFEHQKELDQLMQQDILSPSSTPHSYHHRRTLSDNNLITPMTSPGQYDITRQWAKQQQTGCDILSESDTIDQEVAAVTARLSLSSPRHSPYTPRKSITTEASLSSSNSHHKKKSDKALEKLQTEVTALTEQVDRIRASIQEKRKPSRSWHIINIFFKHLLSKSAILCIVFYFLYKQKSPIAYSIINYITPIIQAMVRKLIRKSL